MKKVFNVVRIIAAVVLSFFLFIILFGGTVGYGLTALFEKNLFTTVFTSLDGHELVDQNAELRMTLMDSGINEDAVGDFLNTDAFDEVVSLYFEDFFGALDNDVDASLFTYENVKVIVDEHMDELMPIVNSLYNQIELVDEELLRQQVYDLFEMLTESIPSFTILSNSFNESADTLAFLQMLYTGKFIIPLMVLAVILSVCIFACRYELFEGFIWLAINYFCVGGLTLKMAIDAFNDGKMLVGSMTNELMAVIVSLMSMLGKKMLMLSIVLIVLAIVFGVLYFVIKKYSNKEVVEQEVVL